MMRQIPDPRAPFPTIDDAIAAGHEHVRGLGFPVGFVAEPQPGGFFVRVCYQVPAKRGGRSARSRHETLTAEIGKIDGPAFHPLDSGLLSGRPYLCRRCEKPFGRDDDCPAWLSCENEDGAVAQARLIEAHKQRETTT